MSGMHSLDFKDMTGGRVRPANWKDHKKKHPPSIKRVPLLIQALGVSEPGVADDAHASLVRIAGRDLGRAPQPWKEWWKERGPELLGREDLVRAGRELFARTRNAIAGGNGEEVFSVLSSRVRRTVGREAVETHLGRHAALLRRVYRDAAVSDVRGDGECGWLSVNWGKTGFKMRELPLVMEAGQWRIDQLPWDWRVVESGSHAGDGGAAEVEAARRRERRQAGTDVKGFLRGGLLAGLGLGVLIAAAATPWFVWTPLAAAYTAMIGWLLLRRERGRSPRPASGHKPARAAR